MSTLEIAKKAVQLYAESHPRPTMVTQAQAAEMLSVSRPTVSKYIAQGKIRLNRLGLIPTVQIDELIGG